MTGSVIFINSIINQSIQFIRDDQAGVTKKYLCFIFFKQGVEIGNGFAFKFKNKIAFSFQKKF